MNCLDPGFYLSSLEEMRIYRCWLEFYNVDENTNRRAVERVRECEDEPTGVPPSASGDGEDANGAGGGGGGDPTNAKGPGKGGKGGKGGGKNKGKPKDENKPKKERTEDQLARAVPQLNHDFRPFQLKHFSKICSLRLPGQIVA